MERHDSFTVWLAGGAVGELQRDVAIHASACPECLMAAAAFDALGRIDVGAAPEPPIVAVEREPGLRVVRGSLWLAGLAIVLAVATTGAMAANGVFEAIPAAGDLEAISSSPTAGATSGGAVLGDRGSPRPSGSDESDPGSSASVDPEPSDPAGSVGPVASAWLAAPIPTFRGQPLPTIRPGASPSGAAATSTPVPSPTPAATSPPTPVPTAVPTPVPTPVPTATPVPPACSNGIDDDGDLLVDVGNDPGCESALDDDETDP
ncbi:MAG TPA: hypothetical protein VI277_06935 [Candidatus Limnocylindria bacterium]